MSKILDPNHDEKYRKFKAMLALTGRVMQTPWHIMIDNDLRKKQMDEKREFQKKTGKTIHAVAEEDDDGTPILRIPAKQYNEKKQQIHRKIQQWRALYNLGDEVRKPIIILQ